jgi:GNAT superfamily N-acetyltransferase
MSIRTVRPDEYADFIAFINAGMRPEPTATRAEEDFPVILGRDNLAGLWGLPDDLGWAAGLTVLVRPFTTTAGPLPVAGIGSVVTRPDRRGEGLSSRLQTTVLGQLAGRGVPLAVLWTDQPEIYAGRGFGAAGWEYHLDLTAADLDVPVPPGADIRPFRAADTTAVAMLYGGHALRTIRESGDDRRLYTMPGTRGLVLAAAGDILAYAFCGKGEDFPGYVTEWGGSPAHVLPVLAAARRMGLAGRVLVPAGAEALLEQAGRHGAGFALVPCGLWAVLRSDLLVQACGPTPGDPRLAMTWLGQPGPEGGMPRAGRLKIAVWGFDSV